MSHPVIDLLQRRRAGQTTNTEHHFKVALVVQGGGMRCVASAGVVLALEDAGMFPCFDAFYGSSAGAMIASYFVARQSHIGASILVDDLSSRDFLDLGRVLKRRGPLMSLDHLCNDVINGRKPLNVSAVREAQLHMVATSASTGQSVRLTPFRDDNEIIAALRATCSLPLVCGPAAPYRDDVFFDGGIQESIPFRAALEDGCTHILVAASTPWGAERRSSAEVGHRFLALLLRKKHPAVAREVRSRVKSYLADLSYLQSLTERPSSSSPFIYAVTPTGSLLAPLERKRATLIAGLHDGYQAMQSALSPDIDRPDRPGMMK